MALYNKIPLDYTSTKKEEAMKVSSIEKNKAFAYFLFIKDCTKIVDDDNVDLAQY